MNIDIAVLELTCSRFCHDLISPIGAVNNGLELLEDEQDPALVAEARGLAERSARRASVLLQTYRCAFGNAGNQAGFGLADALKLGRDFLEGGRVALAGVPAVVPDDLPAGFAKLLLLGIMIMSETLPRGGTLTVEVSGAGTAAGFRLLAEGAQLALGDEYNAILAATPPANLDARNVLPYFAGLTARRLGMEVRLEPAGTGRLEMLANSKIP